MAWTSHVDLILVPDHSSVSRILQLSLIHVAEYSPFDGHRVRSERREERGAGGDACGGVGLDAAYLGPRVDAGTNLWCG